MLTTPAPQPDQNSRSQTLSTVFRFMNQDFLATSHFWIENSQPQKWRGKSEKKQPEVQWWEALEGGFLRTRATVWVSLRAVEVWLTTEVQLTMVLDTVMTVRLPWSCCRACCCCCCHPPSSPPGCCPCCPAVWDGFLCWPPAPIDTIVEQPCPADFPQLNAASRNISNIWKIWIFGIFSNISSTQHICTKIFTNKTPTFSFCQIMRSETAALWVGFRKTVLRIGHHHHRGHEGNI